VPVTVPVNVGIRLLATDRQDPNWLVANQSVVTHFPFLKSQNVSRGAPNLMCGSYAWVGPQKALRQDKQKIIGSEITDPLIVGTPRGPKLSRSDTVASSNTSGVKAAPSLKQCIFCTGSGDESLLFVHV
jgi:hypothetical protein